LLLGYFSNKVVQFLPGVALDHNPPNYASHENYRLQTYTNMSGLLDEMGLANFLPGLASSRDPLNLRQRAGIIGMSHGAQQIFSSSR
jgi:hypothetical protein